jgi:hypothetical protein
MIAMRPRLVHALLVASALAAAGCSSCKKQPKPEEVKKDLAQPMKLDEVPAPEDTALEVVVKDPEVFAKKAIDGAGYGAEIGASPYDKLIEAVIDENAKKALKAIDPHGAVAAVVLLKVSAVDKPHGCGAAHLKDPDIAQTALSSAAKGGDLKTWQSKSLDTTVYEAGEKAQIAIYGDTVILADTRDAIEAAGKYVAYKSVNGAKLAHDLVLRVPMQKIGPAAKKVAKDEYGKLGPSDVPPKVKAELDPLIEPLLTGVADMGEMVLNLDVDGGYLKSDHVVAAKGSFSTWLAAYPAGDASALLSMPRGEGAGLFRFSDGLGPIAYVLAEEGIAKASSMTTADKADAIKNLRELGKATGHEFSYANKSVTGSGAGALGGGALDSEFFFRLELVDAKAGRAAVAALRRHVVSFAGVTGAGAPKITPYKKFGADGEEIEAEGSAYTLGTLTGAAASKDHFLWAVKGPYLYADVCLGCSGTLFDLALDPASKATLGEDPSAKAKIGTYPSKGIITASYADAWTFPKGMLIGSSMAPSGLKPGMPMWGWSTASSDGLEMKGGIPLAFVGDLVRFYLGILARMGGLGASPY